MILLASIILLDQNFIVKYVGILVFETCFSAKTPTDGGTTNCAKTVEVLPKLRKKPRSDDRSTSDRAYYYIFISHNISCLNADIASEEAHQNSRKKVCCSSRKSPPKVRFNYIFTEGHQHFEV